MTSPPESPQLMITHATSVAAGFGEAGSLSVGWITLVPGPFVVTLCPAGDPAGILASVQADASPATLLLAPSLPPGAYVVVVEAQIGGKAGPASPPFPIDRLAAPAPESVPDERDFGDDFPLYAKAAWPPVIGADRYLARMTVVRPWIDAPPAAEELQDLPASPAAFARPDPGMDSPDWITIAVQATTAAGTAIPGPATSITIT